MGSSSGILFINPMIASATPRIAIIPTILPIKIITGLLEIAIRVSTESNENIISVNSIDTTTCQTGDNPLILNILKCFFLWVIFS